MKYFLTRRRRSELSPWCFAVAFAYVASAADLHVPGGYPTIQAAIDASTNGDSVIVAPGLYIEAINLLGRQITLRGSGGPAATILDGTELGVSIVTANGGETLQTVLEGFTLRNGSGTLTPNCRTSLSWVGGAVFARNSQLTMRDCVFRDNGISLGFEMEAGAAIYAQNAVLDVLNSSFEHNGGFGDSGDGLHSGGAIFACDGSSLTIDGSIFTDNGPAGHGGAVYVQFSDLTLTNSSFFGNRGSHGGGVKAFATFGDTHTIHNCHFEDNVSSHGGGLNATCGQTTVSACTFTRNTASFGGGVSIRVLEGVARFTDVDVVDNDAGFGGGLFGEVDDDGVLVIANAVVTDNVASAACCPTGIYASECYNDGGTFPRYWGGGADLRTLFGGEIRVYNSLFARNRATRAGGVHLGACGGGFIDFTNNTVVENTPTGVHIRNGGAASEGGAAGEIAASNVILANNVDAIEVSLVNTTVQPVIRFSNVTGGFPGTGNIDLPPLFVDAAGGDFRLAVGSPGVDAADNGALPTDVLVDLAGAARFVDDPATPDTGAGAAPVIDMGAYEFQPGNCPADLDGNGTVNLQDLAILLSNFGNSGEPTDGDLDGDGVVGLADLAELLSVFGGPCG